MIRYPITETALRQRIDTAAPGWLAKAADRTAVLVQDQSFHKDKRTRADGSTISVPNWSAIKSVYRDLQGHSCAYCEKPMAIDYGSIEHDVEHYRPKSAVGSWGKRGDIPRPRLGFQIRKGRPQGYYWLAYEPLNYCASCKTCNSTLKHTRFPTLAAPGSPPETPRELGDERPLLLYPIGHLDQDPEAVIQWAGTVATWSGTSGETEKRAKANIEFFQLNRREDLARGRASEIVAAWRYLERERDVSLSSAERQCARDAVDNLRANIQRPHAACLRAFIDLARSDWTEASRQFAPIETLHLSTVGHAAHRVSSR